MWSFTVFGAIILVLNIMNGAISACRFLKVESSYMRVSTVPRVGTSRTALLTDLLSFFILPGQTIGYWRLFEVDLCIQ